LTKTNGQRYDYFGRLRKKIQNSDQSEVNLLETEDRPPEDSDELKPHDGPDVNFRGKTHYVEKVGVSEIVFFTPEKADPFYHSADDCGLRLNMTYAREMWRASALENLIPCSRCRRELCQGERKPSQIAYDNASEHKRRYLNKLRAREVRKRKVLSSYAEDANSTCFFTSSDPYYHASKRCAAETSGPYTTVSVEEVVRQNADHWPCPLCRQKLFRFEQIPSYEQKIALWHTVAKRKRTARMSQMSNQTPI
jgi:hypothetical protein